MKSVNLVDDPSRIAEPAGHLARKFEAQSRIPPPYVKEHHPAQRAARGAFEWGCRPWLLK